ncbi:MAG: Omp28-related outer membrane protein [candidate division WOR-3 bacterium]|nr:MAG: Omp28-related outer membrane protein [candidate division WOR-3 bacterium]
MYTAYPLGLAEAYQRWHFYPPPYWYNNNWYYATPWLWIDGDKDGAYIYSQWNTMITQRMAEPAPVTATVWGEYFPATYTGTINAQFRNDSSEAISGRAMFCITEDSLYYPAGNGDQWHNHVARDYLPDYMGESVSIPAGDSITVSQAFTVNPSWNTVKLNFVAWIQDASMQPDSTIEIWQGGKLPFADLTVGIEEYGNEETSISRIAPVPNPCVNGTRFAFTLSAGESYRILFYDVSGRQVRTIHGVGSGSEQTATWDLKNDMGTKVSAGVYLYRFESAETSTSGKVIVQ